MSKSGTNSLKGKSYVEIYGKEKAEQLRISRSNIKPYVRDAEWRKNRSNKAKLYIGEKNPFYGRKHTSDTKEKISKTRREMFGERQTINKQVRRYWRISEWRKLVFERDAYTCQMCGAHNHIGNGRSVKLNAHHIKELTKIIGNCSFEEVIKNPELYDLNNGITLCDKCHKKIHGWKSL